MLASSSEQKSRQVILWITFCEISTNGRPVPELGVGNTCHGFGERPGIPCRLDCLRDLIERSHCANAQYPILPLDPLQ